MRPLALWLTLVWALVSFVPPFFAREPWLQIDGASLAMWMAAQVGPLVYVLLAWLYERRASRLEAQQRAQRGG
jgi:putative solute:sodium symporter small subunit